VEDLDEMEEKIREAGGMIVIHKVPVPNVGLLTLFKDPDGRVLGMWKRRDAAP
jgi:predicted enzyme related to lactoylglutathione lyase